MFLEITTTRSPDGKITRCWQLTWGLLALAVWSLIASLEFLEIGKMKSADGRVTARTIRPGWGFWVVAGVVVWLAIAAALQ